MGAFASEEIVKRIETCLTTWGIAIIVEAKIMAVRKRSRWLELSERDARGWKVFSG
ncbi:hypothetical protein NXH76_16905 [Blautia schinkii]|nr:hypothetical protein [Blautia schinkii]